MSVAVHQRVRHPDGRLGWVSDVRDGGRSIYVTYFGGTVELVTPEDLERWARRSEYAGFAEKAEAWGFRWVDDPEGSTT